MIRIIFEKLSQVVPFKTTVIFSGTPVENIPFIIKMFVIQNDKR